MVSLDNPVWSSLTGAHAHLAEGLGKARRYRPDVTPFSAIVDDDGWPDLAALVSAGNETVVFQPGITPPHSWDVLARLSVLQMVATTPIAPPAESFDVLVDADVADMRSLVAVTGPGPFGWRTIELGGYVGVHDDGRLIAMAGERMHPEGFGEVSAVCTHPTHRGRGLASMLVRTVASAIQARGDVPVLHVLDDNVDAIRVYERLGFRTRVEFDVLRLQLAGT